MAIDDGGHGLVHGHVSTAGVRVEVGYRLDIVVEAAVIVEVKAVERLLPVHEAQLLSYSRLSGTRVGLLIDLNVAHLRHGIRRRILGYGP